MRKKLFSLLLSLCMIVSIIPNGVFAENNVSSKDIVIMHTNDIHSRVDDNLGYTSVKGWKNHFEQNGNEVLLLDAGDSLHGLPIANLSNGENIVKIMNEVGYDAMTAGNHDFNYGMKQLLNLTGKMDFDFLVSNISKDGKNAFTSSNIYEKAGKKIGVVGLSTPETATKTNPANVEGYSFNNDKLSEILQSEVDLLEKQGVDYVIVLGHLGIDSESSPYMSTEVISKIEGVDIFIDGHSHHTLEKGLTVKDKTGKDVLLAQTGNYLQNIGKIIIKENGEISASLINEKKLDEKIDSIINSQKEEIQPLLDEVVGKTNVFLDGNRDPGVRTKETNLGNLVADALKFAARADVALTNGGGIRTSVDVGNITYGELNAVLPFGNVVTKIEVTGEQIVKALEHGTSAVPNASGGFPQVSGITYEIHTYLTENRVKNVKINGQEVDLNKTYTLSTNDFTAVGGDGYEMFKDAKKLGEYAALDEALINFIKQLPNSTVGDEYASEQGRITIYNEPIVSDEGDDNQEDVEDKEDNDQDSSEGDKEEDNNQGSEEDEDNSNVGDTEDKEEDDSQGSEEGTDKDDNSELEQDKEDSPRTGDNNMIALYAVMFIISISVLSLMVIEKRKKAINK
ncbi:5'-nucleotidase C-terminal domain-containing protein [Terrisporobacter sp.]